MKGILALTLLSGSLALPQASFSEHTEIEDIFNRYGGPPLYRYYHMIPSHGKQYGESSRLRPDANDYWGDRYYGNPEVDPYQDYRLERDIFELEREE